MKQRGFSWALAVLLAAPLAGNAQPVAQRAGTTSLSELIEVAARKSGKTFIVDPRVTADVTLIGPEPADISYDQFLSVLQVHGFAAIESGGLVRVIPDAVVRAAPLPLVTGKDSRHDADYVTGTIVVRNMPAGTLIPVLRPLLPQHAHLAAAVCANTIIVVDSFANVRRIEELIRAIDTGEAYQVPTCEAPVAPLPQRNVPPGRSSN